MRCHSQAGKTFLAISLFFGILALMMRVITDTDWLGAMLLFFLFAAATGIPGWLLCKNANRNQQNMQQQMQQFIKQHKSFYMPELAKFLGLHEEQTRLNVLRLIQKDAIDLVYGSDSDRYGFPDSISDEGVAEACTSCNGRIIASKFIDHRDANCPFCGIQRVQYSTH